MPLPDPVPLLSFAAAALLAFMFGLVISGQFPPVRRDPALRAGAGRLLLWASCGIAIALAASTVQLAVALLAWPYAVVAGGLAFLAAPFGMRLLPLAATDGPTALAAFSVIAAGGLLVVQLAL